jgi:AraC family transcriptional regulator
MVDTRVKTNESAVAWLEPSRIENGKAMLIAGLRGHFTSANWDGIPAQWQRLGTYGKVPG